MLLLSLGMVYMAFFPLLPYRSAVTSHTVIPHLLAAVWCVAVSTIIGYLHLHPIESYKAVKLITYYHININISLK